MEKTKARILHFDIESSPNLGYGYGKWDVRMLKIMQYSDIMCFSYNWDDEKEIHHVNPFNILRREGQSTSHRLAERLAELFDEADVVVAHNAYGFDVKIVNASFIRHDIPLPSPYKIVDTLRIARSQFKFPGGNSLDEVAKFLGIEGKASIGVGELWYDCLQGKREAWRLMQIYNDQDVVVLKQIYRKMLPHVKNHPNIGDILQRDGVCPKCGSAKLQKRGFNTRRNGKTQRFMCMDCGGWCNQANLKKEGRIVNA